MTCLNGYKNSKGEILTISLIFIGIAITIFTFVLTIFMSHINTVLYNLKIDMYSLNRSAIISVNKYHTSIDSFSYNVDTYKHEFTKGLIQNYNLNENYIQKNKIH